jgi:uncharacterized protein YjbI with pentapeptide repeats
MKNCEKELAELVKKKGDLRKANMKLSEQDNNRQYSYLSGADLSKANLVGAVRA